MKSIIKLLVLSAALLPCAFTSCKDVEIVEPSVQVTTLDYSSIRTNPAIGSGYITRGDVARLTERGICWSTMTAPTIADNKAISTDDAARHDFSVQLTGLSANTLYYARAYVSDGSAVHYGNEIAFTTKDQPGEAWCLIEEITEITASAATVSMTMASDGNNEIAEIGICFTAVADSDVEDVKDDPNVPNVEDDEVRSINGGRDFTVELTDLTQNTLYYVKPFIRTEAGEVTYGDKVEFRTTNFIISLETWPGYKTCYFFGETIANETDPTTERGFAWGENPEPTLENASSKIVSGTNGQFNLLTGGLEKGKTYYVRAYAKNSSGTYYGEEMSFTTKTGNVLPGITLEDMVLVEAGTFQMGYPQSATVPSMIDSRTLNSETVHTVTLTKDFYMNKYETTNEQMCVFLNVYPLNGNSSKIYNTAFYNSAGRTFSFKSPSEAGSHVPQTGYEKAPTANITYTCAYEYCRWLSAELGVEVRLPTEAEWEFAAQGGNKSQGYIYSGSNDPDEVGVYNGQNPMPVGSLKPNELGIYDMSGNVFEVCADAYSHTFYQEGAVDPCNRDNNLPGSTRCIRGGSYRHSSHADPTKDYQVIRRRGNNSSGTSAGNHFGMRIVMSKLPQSLD